MRYALVTGPTRSETSLYSDTPIPSYTDALNAKLEELESQGITNYTVQCTPHGDHWHYGYIAYEPVAHAVAAVELPKTLTIQQVADNLNVSRWYVSDRIRRGELRAINLGKRKVIPFEEYTRFASPS